MVPLATIRLVVLGVVSLFSLIMLGIASHFTSITSSDGFYFSFAALSIATSVLTLISLPAMIFLDRTRQGAVTSMIAIEIGWLGFLGILWVASAGSTSSATFGYTGTCRSSNSLASTVCNEVKAIQAFGYLNWLALWGYVATLLVFSIMASNRGQNGIWTQSVKDMDPNAEKTTGSPAVPHQVQQVYNAPYTQPVQPVQPVQYPNQQSQV